MLSVNTNYSAMIALQNLNFTNNELEGVQNKISTGLKISSARDNGAIYAIAEGQRSRVSSVAAVKDGIDRAKGPAGRSPTELASGSLSADSPQLSIEVEPSAANG
jgi:flagellin